MRKGNGGFTLAGCLGLMLIGASLSAALMPTLTEGGTPASCGPVAPLLTVKPAGILSLGSNAGSSIGLTDNTADRLVASVLPVAVAFVATAAVGLVEMRQQNHGNSKWHSQASIGAHRQAVLADIRRDGWLPVVSQLIADAIGEPVSVSTEAGLLDVSAAPAPHFGVTGSDGRRYFFVLDPAPLVARKLNDRQARAISLAEMGPLASVEVQAVWSELVRASGTARQVYAPRDAEWMLIVEGPYHVVPSPLAVWGRLLRRPASGVRRALP